VMGDLGTPALLLDSGASAHDFQLRPSQAVALARADLVVWIGPELTPWLDRALATTASDVPRLGLLQSEGTVLRSYADADEDAAHDDHDDGHGHGGTDPHAWLTPENAILWLPVIAEALGRADPDHAAQYRTNASTAVTALHALDATLAARLDPVRDVPLVMGHDAYGYFADHYGLRIAGTIALGDAASPGAGRLSDLRAMLEANSVRCVFPEATHNPRQAEALTEGTAARLGPALDPTGTSLDPGPGLYAAVLAGLTDAILSCTE
jgi:zinc transport system substrate-binding protein